ncbi:hypothetical protein LCGC14_2847090 [marine sediment metagenome]|uniref:Uncharacterized protein n=1 Tax=marine sediment metagenome TaxID=412755 RepID=A0A0F9B0I7_9ZZZZ
MDVQYKFRWILRDDDGVIIQVSIAFYSGNYNSKKNTFSIRRKLKKSSLRHLRSRRFKGDDVLYGPENFGIISTDDELRNFLNTEIAKDKTRKAIPEQRLR